MRSQVRLLNSSFAQLTLGFLFLMVLTSSHPRALHYVTIDETLYSALDIDGTQLVQEAKELLAEEFHLSVSEITAVYCCQLIDGRYQYNCTIPVNNDGFVYFTISGGQIVVEDVEGF